jgi:hypothetical protein
LRNSQFFKNKNENFPCILEGSEKEVGCGEIIKKNIQLMSEQISSLRYSFLMNRKFSRKSIRVYFIFSMFFSHSSFVCTVKFCDSCKEIFGDDTKLTMQNETFSLNGFRWFFVFLSIFLLDFEFLTTAQDTLLVLFTDGGYLHRKMVLMFAQWLFQ